MSHTPLNKNKTAQVNTILFINIDDQQASTVSGGISADIKTGDDITFPNHIFGAGRINAFKSLATLINQI